MCDVGRGAYEAFAAYADDSPAVATVITNVAAKRAASADPTPPSLPPPPPPHGPPVVVNEDQATLSHVGFGKSACQNGNTNGVNGNGVNGYPSGVNGFGVNGYPNGVNGFGASVTVSRSSPSAMPLVAPQCGRLTPLDHESLTQTLKRKLVSAGKRLDQSTSNEEDRALCGLIKDYAEALQAVNKVQSAPLS